MDGSGDRVLDGSRTEKKLSPRMAQRMAAFTKQDIGERLPRETKPSNKLKVSDVPIDGKAIEKSRLGGKDSSEFDRPVKSHISSPLNQLQKPSTKQSLVMSTTTFNESFSTRIKQLALIKLPSGTVLEERVQKATSSDAAVSAVADTSDPISQWILEVKSILHDVKVSDDVERIAKSRECIQGLGNDIDKYGDLITTYISVVGSIMRESDETNPALEEIVLMMEEITDGWEEVKQLLDSIKLQMEISLEWVELDGMVLFEIEKELQCCQNMIFEMEERRHQALATDVDIEALATIIDDNQPLSKLSEDGSTTLVKLSARMQPLKASLNFLPMRIASFGSRAETIFPTSVLDINYRHEKLSGLWKSINADATNLEREIGEDKWIAIFRNAGKQATDMMDSIKRSLRKLQANLVDSPAPNMPPEFEPQKIENYEAKRVHYTPAVIRVLDLIAKGTQERLTVNGEILRLLSAMQHRWSRMEDEMVIMDARISASPKLHTNSNHQKRPSGDGSITSSDRVFSVSTKASSPTSSVADPPFTKLPYTPKRPQSGIPVPKYTPMAPPSAKTVGARSESSFGFRSDTLSPLLSERPRITRPPSRLHVAPNLDQGNGDPNVLMEPRPRWNISPKIASPQMKSISKISTNSTQNLRRPVSTRPGLSTAVPTYKASTPNLRAKTTPNLRTRASLATMTSPTRRMPHYGTLGDLPLEFGDPVTPQRPVSVAGSRRSSMLPRPRVHSNYSDME